jgi:hypothetical protein
VTPTLIRAIVKEHSDSIRATLGDDKYWKSKYVSSRVYSSDCSNLQQCVIAYVIFYVSALRPRYALAHDILLESLLRPTLDDFITSKCYPYICTITQGIAKL